MKKFLCLILLLFCTYVFADEWIADPDTGCKVFNPNPQPNESIKWTGACKDGKASGSGSVIWYKHQKFSQKDDGVFEDGKNVTINLTSQGRALYAKGKYRESMLYFQQASDLGDSNAMQWLGHIYLKGIGGVKKDVTKAVKLLKQAQSTGDIAATYNLGILTFEGNGVKRDYNQAANMLKKSLLSPVSKGIVLDDGKTIYSASEEALRKLIADDLISDAKLRDEVRQLIAN